MGQIEDALDCAPQGGFVSEDKVKKFSEELKEGEKAHFAAGLDYIERNGEIHNTARQNLAIFTDRRILILTKKLTGKNTKNSIRYEGISEVELKTGLSNKKIIFSGQGKEIIFKVLRPGKQECADIVKFVQNVLEKNDNLGEGLSKGSQKDQYSPKGSYVNQERIKKVEDVLDEDENVHYITSGSTVDVEGSQAGVSLFGDDRSRKSGTKGWVRAAFTQKRVVIKIPQWLGSDERTIPYHNITSVDLDTGLVNKRITLQTPGQTYHVEAQNPDKTECRNIVKFVRDKIRESQKQNSNDSSKKSPLDRLEKLKDLHDQGALSDEEFEEKKQELMSEI